MFWLLLVLHVTVSVWGKWLFWILKHRHRLSWVNWTEPSGRLLNPQSSHLCRRCWTWQNCIGCFHSSVHSNKDPHVGNFGSRSVSCHRFRMEDHVPVTGCHGNRRFKESACSLCGDFYRVEVTVQQNFVEKLFGAVM